MEFQIDPASRLPIYRQLTRQLREAVARGGVSSRMNGFLRYGTFQGRW